MSNQKYSTCQRTISFKNIFLGLVFAVLFSNKAYAQTKIDTQDWLKIQLDKYFSTSSYNNGYYHGFFNGWDPKFKSYLKGIVGEERAFGDMFFFEGTLLEVSHTTTTRMYLKQNNEDIKDTLTERIITTLDLSRLKYIDTEMHRDTTANTFDLSFNFYFGFKTKLPTEQPVVEEYNVLSNKWLTPKINIPGKTYYQMNFDLHCNNPKIMEDSMSKRIIKALNHLARLNGARIIGDIF